MMLNNFLTRFLARRLLPWAIRHRRENDPSVVIGGAIDPYLIRWYVIPRNRWFNIYLHEFRRSDDDRALHDHPWWSVSLSLNFAMEEIYRDWSGKESWRKVPVGSLVFRRASFAHRMIVPRRGALTIFITGPKIREWGFHCANGWRHWCEFVKKGCD